MFYSLAVSILIKAYPNETAVVLSMSTEGGWRHAACRVVAAISERGGTFENHSTWIDYNLFRFFIISRSTVYYSGIIQFSYRHKQSSVFKSLHKRPSLVQRYDKPMLALTHTGARWTTLNIISMNSMHFQCRQQRDTEIMIGHRTSYSSMYAMCTGSSFSAIGFEVDIIGNWWAFLVYRRRRRRNLLGSLATSTNYSTIEGLCTIRAARLVWRLVRIAR